MKRINTHIEEAVLARLQAVADAAPGHTVASIIRFCIEKQLPIVEAYIKSQGSKS